MWLVGGSAVVLTHSSCNHVGVTTPEHFLADSSPKLPHILQIGERLLG